MVVIGIESSCDESSIALYDEDRGLIYMDTFSQLEIHSSFGGVVPEIAARDHLKRLPLLYHNVIKNSSIDKNNIGLVCVTSRPGLIGALLVGTSFAKGIAMGLNKPIVAVDHLEAHMFSVMLEHRVDFPFGVLLVSGGHTLIAEIRDVLDINIVGSTLDDACGESFDKVARMLDLGYPGGPVIERLAREARDSVRFKTPMKQDKNLNFSFSGLKTQVLYYIKNRGLINEDEKKAICRGFQEAVLDHLVDRLNLFIKTYNHKRFVFAGGVAANRFLREGLERWAKDTGRQIFIPSLSYCTDNGAMVALRGLLVYKKRGHDDLGFKAGIYLKNRAPYTS